MRTTTNIDPELDLVFERTVYVAPELVWRAWTEPEHLKPWYTPAPWTTPVCEIDLRPGGVFRTVMRSPDGEEHPNVGCYLEIVPNRKLVWTDALEGEFRPTRAPAHLGFRFTASILLEPYEGGTRYRAIVRHADAASRAKHDEMGFADGWGKAFEQLVAHVKGLG
jgi:uncharacterized protein YndB with AHSA1/START domain